MCKVIFPNCKAMNRKPQFSLFWRDACVTIRAAQLPAQDSVLHSLLGDSSADSLQRYSALLQAQSSFPFNFIEQ